MIDLKLDTMIVLVEERVPGPGGPGTTIMMTEKVRDEEVEVVVVLGAEVGVDEVRVILRVALIGPVVEEVTDHNGVEGIRVKRTTTRLHNKVNIMGAKMSLRVNKVGVTDMTITKVDELQVEEPVVAVGVTLDVAVVGVKPIRIVIKVITTKTNTEVVTVTTNEQGPTVNDTTKEERVHKVVLVYKDEKDTGVRSGVIRGEANDYTLYIFLRREDEDG